MGAKTTMMQMSIFDFLEKEEETTIPIVFHEGDEVFVVNKADVKAAIVLEGKPWVVHNGTSYGYRIQYTNCYGVIFNELLNNSVFFSREGAERVAAEYRKENEVLEIEDINFQNFEAYMYRREIDNYPLVAYMAEIENGLLYIKNFYTYQHIVADTPKNRKAFAKEIEEEKKAHPSLEEFDEIEIKNMYPCHSSGDWLYAEAGYMGCA